MGIFVFFSLAVCMVIGWLLLAACIAFLFCFVLFNCLFGKFYGSNNLIYICHILIAKLRGKLISIIMDFIYLYFHV